eukprot:8258206-Prorocentrum_lima.AAC.1
MMIVGKDLSSIAWVEDISCPFDFGAPVPLLQEHTLEEEYSDPDTDEFLNHIEAEMNPRY